MSADLNMNSTCAILEGTVIYEKGEPVESVALIVNGRVELQADGVRTILGSGNFIGMYDVLQGIPLLIKHWMSWCCMRCRFSSGSRLLSCLEKSRSIGGFLLHL